MVNDPTQFGGRVQVVGEEKSFLRRFAKQIVFSMCATVIGGMILNFPNLVKAVRYAASIIIHTGGDPMTGEGGVIEEAKKKAAEIAKKPPGLPVPVPVPVPNLNPFHKTPAETAAEEERKRLDRERKEAAERNKYIARAEAVGLEYSDDWTIEDFKVKVPIAEEKAAYDGERKSLLASASELKMPVNDDWNNKDLKQAIKEEKDWQWLDGDFQERKRRWVEAIENYQQFLLTGPNSRCPDRRCGYTLRFKPSRTGSYVCPKCHGHWTVAQAKACYSPPPPPKEPLPPRRKPSLLKRMFG